MGYNGGNRRLRSSMFSKRASRSDKAVINLLTSAIIAPLAMMPNNAPEPSPEADIADSKLKNWQAYLLAGLFALGFAFLTYLFWIGRIVLEVLWTIGSFFTIVGAIYFLLIPIERKKRAGKTSEGGEKS